jgi:hypothetical protein
VGRCERNRILRRILSEKEIEIVWTIRWKLTLMLVLIAMMTSILAGRHWSNRDSNCNRTRHECSINCVNVSLCTPALIFHKPWQETCSALWWELKFQLSISSEQIPIFYLIKFGKYGTFNVGPSFGVGACYRASRHLYFWGI